MIVTCDGHSYDESLLTPGGWALDVGARGFEFAVAMSFRGLNVIAMEPDATATYEGPYSGIIEFDILRLNVALVGTPRESAMYAGWSDGTGNMLATERPAHAETYVAVPCLTLADLMKQECIPQFDIVKLDCEGSEYDILWNWPRHAAVQISAEFHDFLGMNPRHPDVDRYYRELFDGPLKDYEIVQHECTPLTPENPIPNYWNSLFILRPEFRRTPSP